MLASTVIVIERLVDLIISTWIRRDHRFVNHCASEADLIIKFNHFNYGNVIQCRCHYKVPVQKTIA